MGVHLQGTGKDVGEPEVGRAPRDQRKIQEGRGQEEDSSEAVEKKTGCLGRDPHLSKDMRVEISYVSFDKLQYCFKCILSFCLLLQFKNFI